jgi:hypothetical protein
MWNIQLEHVLAFKKWRPMLRRTTVTGAAGSRLLERERPRVGAASWSLVSDVAVASAGTLYAFEEGSTDEIALILIERQNLKI